MEIERKWLMPKLELDLPIIDSCIILQSYLSVEPEVRIREAIWTPTSIISEELARCPYTLTIKGKGGLARVEVEKELTKAEYDELFEMTGQKPIKKDFRTYQLPSGLTLEVSNVDDKYIYAEIEFDSIALANVFITPDWFGKEVTEDSWYKLKNYWERTRL